MIHVRDEGQGEVFLLVHGLGASSRVFEHAFETRPEGRRLIAVDLPRTARSRHYAPSDPTAIAQVLLNELEARNVNQFGVFGHSFGGLVALALATHATQRITRLTVASAPALGLPSEFKLLLHNPMADMTMGMFGRLPVWRPMLRGYLEYIWGEPRKLADHHLQIYEEALAAEGFSEGMLEAMRAVSRFRLEPAIIAAANFKKTVVWGDRDPLVPVVQGEHLARAIGADFVVLPGGGHCVPEEHPAGVLLD